MRRNWCSAVHSALLCASRTISIGASAASAPRSCSWPSERGGGNPAGSCCCMLCKPAALDEPIGPATMLLRWFQRSERSRESTVEPGTPSSWARNFASSDEQRLVCACIRSCAVHMCGDVNLEKIKNVQKRQKI